MQIDFFFNKFNIMKLCKSCENYSEVILNKSNKFKIFGTLDI